MKYIYSILILFLFGCQNDGIEPVGFFEVNYYTAQGEDQIFKYYFDDGELVAGGLDEYMAAVHTVAGTFDKEKLLILNFRKDKGALPDSIYPFTYFTGLSYNDSVHKPVEFRLNIDYPFNNNAHADFQEEQFFRRNLDQMYLVKKKYDGPSALYYDPDFTLEEIPFTIDEEANEIVFSTSDLQSMYGLCWIEEQWVDSIQFDVSGSYANSQELVYKGFRTTPINPAGATIRSSNLILNYSRNEEKHETNNSTSGWQIHEAYILIQDPAEGKIDKKDVDFNLLAGRKSSGAGEIYSHFKLTSSTDIEILRWPEVNEYGAIKFSGILQVESSQTDVAIDMVIKFKRQR